MSASFGSKARKFMGWKASDDEESYDDASSYNESEDAEVAPLASVSAFSRHSSTSRLGSYESVSSGADVSRIVTIRASIYADARSIAIAFKEGVPVIVNLVDMEESEARRLLDFLAGVTFGLDGGFEKVDSRVFLLSPQSVEVEGSEAAGSTNLFG